VERLASPPEAELLLGGGGGGWLGRGRCSVVMAPAVAAECAGGEVHVERLASPPEAELLFGAGGGRWRLSRSRLTTTSAKFVFSVFRPLNEPSFVH